jgi:hypothetical protein
VDGINVADLHIDLVKAMLGGEAGSVRCSLLAACTQRLTSPHASSAQPCRGLLTLPREFART